MNESDAEKIVEMKDSVRVDLRRVSEWAAMISVQFSHTQIRYHLIQTQRKIKSVPEEWVSNVIHDEIERLLNDIYEIEEDLDLRIRWAEDVLRLTYRV